MVGGGRSDRGLIRAEASVNGFEPTHEARNRPWAYGPMPADLDIQVPDHFFVRSHVRFHVRFLEAQKPFISLN